MFIGCTRKNNYGYEETPNSSVNSSPLITATTLPGIHSDIVLPDYIEPSDSLNIIYPAYLIMRYHNLESWQLLIKEKFEIEVNIIYEYSIPIDELTDTQKTNTVLYLNYTKGYPYEFNTRVYDLCDERIAYDLSPYYLKYGWDSFIDPSYIELLKTNEKIYAVPATNKKYILPRYYNKEYLSELNLEVPTNVMELYNYLLATKNLNSSDDSFYPICIFSPYITISTADIFRAYGVYFNSADNLTITYNHNVNSFEDGVFSDGIESALTYIRTLQNENLMLICGNFINTNSDGQIADVFNTSYEKINKKFATEYGVVYVPEKNGFIRDGIEPYTQTAYESLNGYYLTGTNVNNVCEVKSDLAFYVFPKKNNNINETIALFNDIFTRPDYYANFRYGRDEIDYSIINSEIIISPPLTGAFLDLKNIKPIEDNNASLVPESNIVVERLSSDMWFEKNVFNAYQTYLKHGDGFNAHSQHDLMKILFNESLSPYDSINEYKKQFRLLGLEQIINNLNDRLGTTSSYNYD